MSLWQNSCIAAITEFLYVIHFSLQPGLPLLLAMSWFFSSNLSWRHHSYIIYLLEFSQLESSQHIHKYCLVYFWLLLHVSKHYWLIIVKYGGKDFSNRSNKILSKWVRSKYVDTYIRIYISNRLIIFSTCTLTTVL